MFLQFANQNGNRWTWTNDKSVNSRLLCQLSYAPLSFPVCLLSKSPILRLINCSAGNLIHSAIGFMISSHIQWIAVDGTLILIFIFLTLSLQLMGLRLKVLSKILAVAVTFFCFCEIFQTAVFCFWKFFGLPDLSFVEFICPNGLYLLWVKCYPMCVNLRSMEWSHSLSFPELSCHLIWL